MRPAPCCSRSSMFNVRCSTFNCLRPDEHHARCAEEARRQLHRYTRREGPPQRHQQCRPAEDGHQSGERRSEGPGLQHRSEEYWNHRPEGQRSLLALHGAEYPERTRHEEAWHKELRAQPGLPLLLRPTGEEQPLPAGHHRHPQGSHRQRDACLPTSCPRPTSATAPASSAVT